MSIFRLTSETVTEPGILEDVFTPVVTLIERIGPCHRLVFASPGIIYEDGTSDRLDAIPKYLALKTGPARSAGELRLVN